MKASYSTSPSLVAGRPVGTPVRRSERRVTQRLAFRTAAVAAQSTTAPLTKEDLVNYLEIG